MENSPALQKSPSLLLWRNGKVDVLFYCMNSFIIKFKMRQNSQNEKIVVALGSQYRLGNGIIKPSGNSTT